MKKLFYFIFILACNNFTSAMDSDVAQAINTSLMFSKMLHKPLETVRVGNKEIKFKTDDTSTTTAEIYILLQDQPKIRTIIQQPGGDRIITETSPKMHVQSIILSEDGNHEIINYNTHDEK